MQISRSLRSQVAAIIERSRAESTSRKKLNDILFTSNGLEEADAEIMHAKLIVLQRRCEDLDSMLSSLRKQSEHERIEFEIKEQHLTSELHVYPKKLEGIKNSYDEEISMLTALLHRSNIAIDSSKADIDQFKKRIEELEKKCHESQITEAALTKSLDNQVSAIKQEVIANRFLISTLYFDLFYYFLYLSPMIRNPCIVSVSYAIIAFGIMYLISSLSSSNSSSCFADPLETTTNVYSRKKKES